MVNLVYVSSARALLAEADLDTLLHVSCANNAQAALTGMLIYSDGTFIQVIEGEQGAVEALFETIKADTRHHHVTRILTLNEAEDRIFADWTMSYRRTAPATEACFVDLDAGSPELRRRLLGNAPAVRLLRQFLTANRILLA